MRGRDTLVRAPWWRRVSYLMTDRELVHGIAALAAVAIFLTLLFVAARIAMLAGLS